MLDAIFLQGFGVDLVPFTVALYSAPYTKKNRNEAEQRRFASDKIRQTLNRSPELSDYIMERRVAGSRPIRYISSFEGCAAWVRKCRNPGETPTACIGRDDLEGF